MLAGMTSLATQRALALIGFPIDLGGNRRGVDMGPSAIRLAQLQERLEALGHDVHDMGNVIVHTRSIADHGDDSARFKPEIVRSCESAAEMVEQALADGRFPLTLGGDHSVAMGSLWGMARQHGPGGIIWIDAHADLNTPETTLSGNVHGMTLAVALGRCQPDSGFYSGAWPRQTVLPERTVLIGLRDLDPAEQEYLRSDGAPTSFTMSDIDRRGLASVVEEAIDIASGGSFLHVSLDMDSVDPLYAPGVGTPVPGGFNYREAHTIMELLSEADISSMDVLEVNPVLDTENKTAELATELICSLLGKRIL